MELFIVFPAFGHCLPVINFIECQAKLNRNVVYHFVTSKVMIEGLKRRNLVAGLESRLVLIGLEDGLESAEELATESTFTNMELPLLTYLEEALEDTSCRKVVVEMFACRILTEKAWSTIIKFTDKISLFFPSPVSCAYHMCCFEQRIHPENGQRLGENVNVENIYPHSTRPQIIAACVAFAKAARELKDCCVLINSFAEIEQEWVHKVNYVVHRCRN